MNKKSSIVFCLLLVTNTIFSQKNKSKEPDYSRKELRITKDTDIQLNDLPKFKQIENLELEKLEEISLPDVFSQLNSLHTLSIGFNGLTEFPLNILKANNLEELTLWAEEKIKEIPSEINNLKSLSVLRIAYLGINELPKSIGDLSNLKEISLEYSPISILPEEFCSLQRLEKFSMYGESKKSLPLKELPQCFGNLKKLKELQIDNLNIESLPDSFSNLSSIETINIENTKNLKQLPENFGNLTTLKNLNLSYTPIKNLPSDFGNLATLQNLNLTSTSLTALPENFGKMNNLRKLVIDGGYRVSDDVYVTEGGISVLPASFPELSNLDSCVITSHAISELPENFGILSKLEYLEFSGNELATFPESFGKLSNLISLIADNNEINKLPISFSQLKNCLKRN
jgi:Leucine-rich repeat (LRR) protein